METVNRKLIIFCFLATGVASVGIWLLAGKSLSEPLKISYKVTRAGLKVTQDNSRKTNTLLDALKNRISQDAGEYGIFVYRLVDGVGYGINEDEIMPAASIMKVPIMVAATKKLNLEDTYILRDGDKQSGSGPMEFMDAGTVLTVSELMQNIGLKSDNTAAVVLTNMTGRDYMLMVLADLGMASSSFSDNTTTARDVGLMWIQIYKKYLTSLKDDLVNSIYEDRLSAGLPSDGVEVVHKVGTGEGVWADAGIVMTEEPLVIVILNKNVDLDQAAKTVPEITKMIWEYESGLMAEKKAENKN